MAPSLRDLIDFILAEIALCGARGASPADILAYINAFYTKSHVSHRNHAVDRRFQEKVWSWLARNPEVSVGRNKEGNQLSLTEVERLADSGASNQLAADGSLDAASHGGVGKPTESAEQAFRVFVSEERTWLAITGHEPDETKVLPTEFTLLSIIAAAKSKGIIQPDLVRLSGQDKRSIPKRTDELHRKGYIQKRPIQVRRARTSLCTLRKFSQEDAAREIVETKAGSAVEKTQAGDMIDFEVFLGKLFDILREYKLISRKDLKRLLGFTDLWRWRILSRALRRLERIGVLKRVRAPSQYSDTRKILHPCVLLIREPSQRDFDMFHEHGWNLLGNSEQVNHGVDEENEDPEPEDVDLDNMEAANVIRQEEGVEEAGRILPSWTPDRSANNQIFDTVDRAGALGMTSQNVLKSCFGNFFRKPLENALARLVDCWQLSQPPHLRHLAIVRDTTIVQRMIHYVYYSARNFQRRVDAGQSAWEAVEYMPRGGRADPRIPAVDAVAHLNQYGLPQSVPELELLKHGNAALLECITAVRPENYFHSGNDATAMQLEDGTYTLGKGYVDTQPGTLQGTDHVRPRGRPKGTPNRPKHQEIADSHMGDPWDVDHAVLKPPTRPTRDDRLVGLSEKERLEALGLDETWTEYSVLLLDRPDTGVYVTPRGRRRPAGKRQGRPRISRVAVFKSPKLTSLPWFCSGREDQAAGASLSPPQASSAHRVAHRVASPTPLDASVSGRPQEHTIDRQQELDRASQIPATTKRSKRRNSQADPSDTQSTSIVGTLGTTEGGLWKRRRLDDVKTEVKQSLTVPRAASAEDPQSTRDESAKYPVNRAVEKDSENRVKRKRSADDQDRAMEAREAAVECFTGTVLTETRSGNEGPSQGESQERLVKRRRHEFETSRGASDEGAAEGPAKGHAALPSATTTKHNADLSADGGHARPADLDTEPVKQPHELSGGQSHQPASKTKGFRTKLMNTDKRGSVALLRKRIITEIVDKAGGAFPWGTELWYPFTTAWRKMEYKGLPDMRTIKSTAKHLIDAGTLRQMTFSGKDSKGVMVTKSIITKPDLEPDDPVIKDLQKNMLAEPKFYFPPNTEIDPAMRTRGIGRRSTEYPKAGAPVPVETGMTVQLHEKPAFVMQGEKRKGRRIQRELLQRIEFEPGVSKQTRPGVVRLMKIHRPLAQAPTSISRPWPRGDVGRTQGPKRLRAGENPPIGFHRVKRGWHPISTIAPYAMFLNPSQAFYASTGTFSTDAGVAALQARKTARDKIADKLPESLDDLLKQARRRKNAALAESVEQDASRFFSESDAILRWELNNEGALRKRAGDLRYINQMIHDQGPFRAAEIEGDIQFVNEEDQKAAAADEPMVTRRRARRRPSPVAAHGEQPWPPLLRPIGSLEAEEVQDVQEDEGSFTEPVISKGKRPVTAAAQGRRLTKLNDSLNADEPATTATAAPAHRHVSRRRFATQLAPSLIQKIMTAIVVVRSLAGGFEGKIVDWNILPRGFPDHDPKLIQDRGKSILGRNRLQLAKMQSDFQERFVEAYAAGKVPRIDYGNLEGYDWERVIDWAHGHLETPSSQRLPDLPATREQFDSLFELREEAPPGVDELYQTVQNVTVGRKRALHAGVAFAVPLSREPKPGKAGISRLEEAKTWIRANVTTPEETYQSTEAWAALRRFDDSLIESAVQSLVSDRIISMGNRGRITPGRNYDVTDHFLSTLGRRRAIEHTQLRRAARFKTKILDPELRERGSFEVNYHAEDGDILALINLAAAGKISLKPRDPPNDKFGLTEGSYVTRQLDKEKLRFSVEVQPVAGLYVDGNPLEERMSSLPAPCPPRVPVTSSLSVPEVIPVWFDIHGQFNKLLWEQVTAAVVGCVAMRPGISATGIASMIKPTMGTWEVQMLLEWMAEAGVARYEGPVEGEEQPGWGVQEWWWMILG